MNTKHIITITGPSGSGKDTAAKILSEITGFPILCSYTTRPKRDGETDGKEHHFVKSCDVSQHSLLAYSQYGGYEYWTCIDQIKDYAIYVIDEEGLRHLENYKEIYLAKLYIYADDSARACRNVTNARIYRDRFRLTFPTSYYDCIITNNGTLDELKIALKRFAYKNVFGDYFSMNRGVINDDERKSYERI